MSQGFLKLKGLRSLLSFQFENKKQKAQQRTQKKFNFVVFQLMFLLACLKHILLKKELVLLFLQPFVSKHIYEYFFLILMYVFVTLKFCILCHFTSRHVTFSRLGEVTRYIGEYVKKKKKFRLQNLEEFFQIERLLSRKKQTNRTSFETCKKGFAFFNQ